MQYRLQIRECGGHGMLDEWEEFTLLYLGDSVEDMLMCAEREIRDWGLEPPSEGLLCDGEFTLDSSEGRWTYLVVDTE